MIEGQAERDLLRSIIIENVYPELDGGLHAVKREVGDQFDVWVDVFAEGHDLLSAVLQYRLAGDAGWLETPMRLVDNDRWYGCFLLDVNGRYQYTIEAFRNVFASWRHNLKKKADVGEDVASELLEGQRLVADAVGRAGAEDRTELEALLNAVERAPDQPTAIRLSLAEELAELMERYPDRSGASSYDRVLEVFVDRPQARFAAWYEMFPRSQGRDPSRGSTFREAEGRLPEIGDMGFDVVYLPPIHPIGESGRKGRNNSLTPAPNDPGSPWAIGSERGGHKAVHPELGTLDDFDHFVATARDLGMEVALDFAIQCSPDHPYVREHPDWFFRRPDGTIRYAENPPKKYQDIYPINFYCEDWQALWQELKSILLFWIDRGIKTFRVDNPHTKPFTFWEWAIRDVQDRHPDVVFLSEAFTRPKVLKYLAKIGFAQSYTYFTWRNFKAELTDYLTELTQSEVSEYLRGNLFANTPDILPEILQKGGRAAFQMRLLLAATLSSVYGIYSGFELCEGRGFPGTEDYVDSEKYQYKVWDWNRRGNIKDYVRRVNAIRKANPALHEYRNLRFYQADDDNVLFYGKTTADRSNLVLVAVNLDPFQAHEATLHLPLDDFGIGIDETFEARELLGGARYLWKGERQTVRLDPNQDPAAIFVLERWPQKDYASPCL